MSKLRLVEGIVRDRSRPTDPDPKPVIRFTIEFIVLVIFQYAIDQFKHQGKDSS